MAVEAEGLPLSELMAQPVEQEASQVPVAVEVEDSRTSPGMQNIQEREEMEVGEK